MISSDHHHPLAFALLGPYLCELWVLCHYFPNPKIYYEIATDSLVVTPAQRLLDCLLL